MSHKARGPARRLCDASAADASPRVCAQPTAGVDNTQRRKWDKEEYAAKAAERQRQEARASQP